MPDFEELPFDDRPDLTRYLIHLTKNTKEEDEYSAFNNLVNILQTGEIWGSNKSKGFIKGPNKATCFMDIPISSLKYILNKDNSNPERPRYEPFGLIITKKEGYRKGCRPVIYLSNIEIQSLKIPKEEQWRVVKLEVTGNNWISWIHEREWRCMGDFKLSKKLLTVFVKNTGDAERLRRLIEKEPRKFKVIPKSIIPLSIICEGLPYL